MPDSQPTYPPIRWYNSLMARVIGLCAVLVMCLLGSVYVITAYYFRQVVEEMEVQTREIADTFRLYAEAHPGEQPDVEKIHESMPPSSRGIPEAFHTVDAPEETRVTPLFTDRGVEMLATHTFDIRGELWRLQVRFTLNPQTEVLRAFKNRYLAALGGVFVVALGLMIYFIVNSLRPLSQLSDSCTKIIEGHPAPVEVRKNYGEILRLEQTFNTMVHALKEKETVEAKLRQAQRLSALGSLAAGIAHDVRNPLNAIKLLSSHALDTLEAAPENGQAADQLRTIRREVDRLDEIVTGFLALAKERELQPEPVRVDAMLDECLHLVRQDAEARGVRLAGELHAGDTQLMIDPKQCTRAILNVLINALEACSSGGRVRLFSRVIEEACQIEIRDDGPGMTKEVAERAFDPYYTTKPTGTGIGLSITRGIIEEHGGTIELSCIVGQGCQVLITLPLPKKGTL